MNVGILLDIVDVGVRETFIFPGNWTEQFPGNLSSQMVGKREALTNRQGESEKGGNGQIKSMSEKKEDEKETCSV